MKPPIVLYELPKRARTDYRIGLSAWTDKSLLDEGTFYPRKTMTAEERLWWYSRFFDVVEVNSSFYAIPSVEMTSSWVERTPDGFLFNVTAFGLLTGHHRALGSGATSTRLARQCSITAAVIPNSFVV